MHTKEISYLNLSYPLGASNRFDCNETFVSIECEDGIYERRLMCFCAVENCTSRRSHWRFMSG